MPPSLPLELSRDVESVQQVAGIGNILKVLTRTTGQRIALVARVTGEEWVCCAVLDEAGFGLVPGDPLDVATTY